MLPEAFGEPAARHRNVTSCPRVQEAFGLKVTAVVPEVMPADTAHATFHKLSRAFLRQMVKIFGWTARLNADLQYPPYKGSQDLPRTYNEATRDDLAASRLME